MLPRMLKGFTIYVDGRGYVGRVQSAKLPALSLMTEAYRAAGMDTEIDIDMGMEKLEAGFTSNDYDAELVKLFGLFSANTALVFRGAIQRQGEDAVPVVIRMQGMVKQIDRPDWEQGKNSGMSATVSLNKYSEDINGERVVDIDVLNGIRVIGGVDQLASIRAALGM